MSKRLAQEEDQLLGTARIPKRELYDYPLSVTLRIFSNDSRHKIAVYPSGMSPFEFPVDLSRNDWASLSRQLSKQLEQMGYEFGPDSRPSPTELEDTLYQLAVTGNDAFRRLFPDDRIRNDIVQFLDDIVDPAVEIVSEKDTTFPWELLYCISPTDEPLSYEHFWGMKYVTARSLIDVNKLGPQFIPSEIVAGTQPRLGLLKDDALPSVPRKESPFFQRLEQSGQIKLYVLRALDPGKRTAELVEFRNFWAKQFHVAHLACHGTYIDNAPRLSRLRLTDAFDITHQEISVSDIEISSHPLVFVNACSGSNLNPLFTSSFAALFLELGARGVVATECEVPDEFAADFAQRLYSYILAGKEIGPSLLATRRYFFEQFGNPSGLLYSLYGRPSIRLVR